MSTVEIRQHIPHLADLRLDEDHEEMLALIRGLRDVAPLGILTAFDVLHAHVLEHFSMEDALMASKEFSSKECHVDEHAAVRKSFTEVRQAIQAGRIDVVPRFADQLAAWLPEHADALDRHLVKFIFHQRTGGAPVTLRR